MKTPLNNLGRDDMQSLSLKLLHGKYVSANSLFFSRLSPLFLPSLTSSSADSFSADSHLFFSRLFFNQLSPLLQPTLTSYSANSHLFFSRLSPFFQRLSPLLQLTFFQPTLTSFAANSHLFFSRLFFSRLLPLLQRHNPLCGFDQVLHRLANFWTAACRQENVREQGCS